MSVGSGARSCRKCDFAGTSWLLAVHEIDNLSGHSVDLDEHCPSLQPFRECPFNPPRLPFQGGVQRKFRVNLLLSVDRYSDRIRYGHSCGSIRNHSGRGSVRLRANLLRGRKGREEKQKPSKHTCPTSHAIAATPHTDYFPQNGVFGNYDLLCAISASFQLVLNRQVTHQEKLVPMSRLCGRCGGTGGWAVRWDRSR